MSPAGPVRTTGPAPGQTPRRGMRQDGPVTSIEPWLREILRCPACTGMLRDGAGPDGGAELQCAACSLAYRIDDGIPVLLVDEARTVS